MPATANEYRVDLDIYNGPLDLLLYLIKRDEIDIYDIPIATITEQFIQYIEVLRAMDLSTVGDFLVMAATLMEIKSRMLLPAEEGDEEGEEEDDPRLELVRQLIEYKRFKDAAATLSEWRAEQDKRLPRPGELDTFARDVEPDGLVEEIGIWHLMEAFAKLMQQTGLGMESTVVYDDTPVQHYMQLILELLERHTILSFFDLFARNRDKSAILGCFLALLELMKQRRVRAEQARDHGDIVLTIRMPEKEAGLRKAGRQIFVLPPRGANPRFAHRLKLRCPLAHMGYQRNARRQVMTVPSRRRAYRACVVTLNAVPALEPPAQPPPYEPPPPASPPATDESVLDGPAPDAVRDDVEEVEAIEVGDVQWEAPRGWTPATPSQPRLSLLRKRARGQGRRFFVPSFPRGYKPSLPRRRSRIIVPVSPSPASRPAQGRPSQEPSAGQRYALRAPEPDAERDAGRGAQLGPVAPSSDVEAAASGPPAPRSEAALGPSEAAPLVEPVCGPLAPMPEAALAPEAKCSEADLPSEPLQSAPAEAPRPLPEVSAAEGAPEDEVQVELKAARRVSRAQVRGPRAAWNAFWAMIVRVAAASWGQLLKRLRRLWGKR